MKFHNPFRRRTQPTPEPAPAPAMSPIEMYLAGGGDLGSCSSRTERLLEEAERGHRRHLEPQGPVHEHEMRRLFERQLAEFERAQQCRPEPQCPLHAHEVTSADAAFMRMMSGASFGPDVTMTLPSGRTITGSEMQRWAKGA